MSARLLTLLPAFPLLPRTLLALGCSLLITAAPAIATAEAPAAPDADVARRISALRDEATQLRSSAEFTYKTTEADCYQRFLVNRCIDTAKAERLTTIRRARALENEAHRLDLAERHRVATEVTGKAPAPPPTAPAVPTPDVSIQPLAPAAEFPAAPKTGALTPARRREQDKANAEAARRAEIARRDRERYDMRIKKYEEKKARDANGR
ncbi:hypothetical protein AGMMS50225_07380 [Betaproteobacteria bacterium]|nr:hypothetical protein AGMMS50225_07380 [Betaproteobacteria bacterium]